MKYLETIIYLIFVLFLGGMMVYAIPKRLEEIRQETKLSTDSSKTNKYIFVPNLGKIPRKTLEPAKYIGSGTNRNGGIMMNFQTNTETILIPPDRVVELNSNGEWYIKPLDYWELKTDREDLPWAIKI